jgi:hypothetical protein
MRRWQASGRESRPRACWAVAALALGVTACSTSSSTTTTSTAGSTTASPTSAAPTTAGSTPATGPTTTAGQSDADAIAAIKKAFTTFFGGSGTTVDAKLEVLQNAETYRSMVADASSNPQFQQLTSDIRDVSLLGATECSAAKEVSPCAKVTFDLLVGGAPMLAAQEGHAVKVDGAWKVSSSTWCAVVSVGGEKCP